MCSFVWGEVRGGDTSVPILICVALGGGENSPCVGLNNLYHCSFTLQTEQYIMRLVILEDYEQVSEWAAKYVRNKILKFNPGPDKYFVLGLPTGNKIHLSNNLQVALVVIPCNYRVRCKKYSLLLYIELSNSFLIDRKHTVNFQTQCL